jgi:threonine/homoserine/homoserine lactone efflux protein
MPSPLFMLFCATSLFAVFTPGPAVMLALQNSTQYGWRRTALSSLGNVSGLLLLSSASAIGLGAVLRSSVTMFFLLKLVGAGYLIYLGVRQWRATGATAGTQRVLAGEHRSRSSLYREGLLLALTNPKAILFITALFPQFIVHEQPLWPQFALLTLTFMALSFCSLMSYAVAGHLARNGFVSALQSRTFRRGTGSLFIFMGIGLLGLKSR